MFYINEIYKTSQELKKSTFHAFLCPFENFNELRQKLKTDHPKAAHIVWAYRHLNKYAQIVENTSDDGEPKGSGGAPCLDALRGAKLVNTAVLVVRYFGGTKLGIGGLVRAYFSSANLAISISNRLKFELKSECTIFVPFSQMQRFFHYFEAQNLEISKIFGEFGCEIRANLSKNEFENFAKFCSENFQNFSQNSTKFSPQNFHFLSLPLFAKNLQK